MARNRVAAYHGGVSTTWRDYPPTCDLGVPGRLPCHGPGWYLMARNGRVECGPFATMDDAGGAAAWLDDQGRGVNPGPWSPVYSTRGLLVGSRPKPRTTHRATTPAR